MKTLFSLLVLMTAASAASAQAVTVRSVSRDAETDEIVVTYDLAEDAVVTMSVTADGVAVPEGRVTRLAGAVNRKVAAGTGLEIRWNATKETPELKSANAAVKLTAWPLDNPPDYMVADLQLANTVRYYTSTNALPGGLANPRYRTSAILMRKIPAKKVTWLMGSAADDKTLDGQTVLHANNETQYWVTFSDNYYIGVYELTQTQAKLMGFTQTTSVNFVISSNQVAKAGYDSTAEFPVSCNLDQMRGTATAPICDVVSTSPIGTLCSLTGVGFDVPTDAQWEYACRAGQSVQVYNGINIQLKTSCTNLNRLAWYGATTKKLCCAPVGLKEPNAWGLYDMLGNMLEWTRDCYAANPYAADSTQTDPVGTGTDKVKRCVRGGNWDNNANNVRAAVRTSYTASTNQHKNYTGLRLYCPAVAK